MFVLRDEGDVPKSGRADSGRVDLVRPFLQPLLRIQPGNHLLPGARLQFQPRHLGHITTLPGHLLTVLEGLWVLGLRDVLGGCLGQHVQDQLRVGHVVAEVLLP